MDTPATNLPSVLAAPQSVRTTLRAGERFVMEAEVKISPAGLLAIGALVSAILIAAGGRRARAPRLADRSG